MGLNGGGSKGSPGPTIGGSIIGGSIGLMFGSILATSSDETPLSSTLLIIISNFLCQLLQQDFEAHLLSGSNLKCLCLYHLIFYL